jgi:hypothetical protein
LERVICAGEKSDATNAIDAFMRWQFSARYAAGLLTIEITS